MRSVACMLTSRSQCLVGGVISWLYFAMDATAERGLTGDLPDDEGAEDCIAENKEWRYPSCVSLVGENVVSEAFSC